MDTPVRVRYAPSPTGMQHIGGVRTALFNYFFARSQGGTFVLRVEDTDQTRFDPRALRDIYDTFEWLGIAADESPAVGGEHGPYVQSARIELYRNLADRLVEAGRAYWDYTSAKRDHDTEASTDGGDTEASGDGEASGDASEAGSDGDASAAGPAGGHGERADAPSASAGYTYEGRQLPAETIAEYQAAGVQPVLRLLVPAEGTSEFEDLVLGRIKRKHKDLPPDPILLKSDGFPTYHLANVIDDHLMGITHVLRAQEWVPSTPLHLLIYEAFGWEPPRFAHLPMVMGKDGSKLSKRHGATSLIEFRRQGYLPEAITNYISMLGWAYDDSREFFTRRELEELFSIEKINKAPAVFDYKKLDWYNGHYIRECDDERLVELLMPYIQEAGWAAAAPSESSSTGPAIGTRQGASSPDAGSAGVAAGPNAIGTREGATAPSDSSSPADRARLAALLPLIKERLKTLADVTDLLRFVYEDVTQWSLDDLIPKKAGATDALQWLDAAAEVLKNQPLPPAGDEAAEEAHTEALRQAAEEQGTKLGNLMMPLRVAVTGSRVSPPLVGSIRELGMDEALRRIAGARAVLEAATTGNADENTRSTT
ncbi:MAG: glutamate--tRNA ligase family protein [Alkalispirochaeta sp.]